MKNNIPIKMQFFRAFVFITQRGKNQNNSYEKDLNNTIYKHYS